MSLGLGVMINALSGHNGGEFVQASLGKTITRVWISDNVLTFLFEDGSVLNLKDEGQSCCEHRYMDSDDNLADYALSVFLDMEIKNVEVDRDDEWGDCQETQFLDITTSKGVFTVKNYNNHNGYYCGFWLCANNGIDYDYPDDIN